MEDSNTDSKRIAYQPLHSSVRSTLDPDYVIHHDEHFQFLEPLKRDTVWDSDLRRAPSRFESTSSGPVKVGSVRNVDLGNFHVRVYTPEGVPPTAGWPVMIGAHGGMVFPFYDPVSLSQRLKQLTQT
jgi:acetyl esterase/lipase